MIRLKIKSNTQIKVSQRNISLTPGIELSGHLFADYGKPLSAVSINNYDPAWHVAQGNWTRAIPSNPLTISELDYEASPQGLRLKENNAYGNKARYTNLLGYYCEDNFWIEDANYVDGDLKDKDGVTISVTSDLFTNAQRVFTSNSESIGSDSAFVLVDHFYGILIAMIFTNEFTGQTVMERMVTAWTAARGGNIYPTGFTGFMPMSSAMYTSFVINETSQWSYSRSVPLWGAVGGGVFAYTGDYRGDNTTQVFAWRREGYFATLNTSSAGAGYPLAVFRPFTNNELPNT